MAKKTKKPSRKGQDTKARLQAERKGILAGRLLSLEFFRRHAWFILIAVVVVLALIGQRYTNQSKRQKIKQLETQLSIAKSDQISCKARYMSLIRENEMRRLLRANHLDLDYQEQPPFVLYE
ncbi:MAG: hypothetical protein K2M14_00215 [Muribaculaceae bacterium]|nr:hypothetical protein [Bacteroidales bacterium]MDE6242411.1 hypothetical protein [Muribaculaceae bacterium]